MTIVDCEFCKLLAVSKDFIGTNCVKCGAVLSSDKFEDELEDVLALPYDAINREYIIEKLSSPRYANTKYYLCHDYRVNYYRVFTHKMLNNMVPGLDNFNIDELFTSGVAKNIYRLCNNIKCNFCVGGKDIVVGCNAAIFYHIIKSCLYDINKYRIVDTPVKLVDPYPEFTEILKGIDVYYNSIGYHIPDIKIPRKYDHIPIYLVDISYIRPYKNKSSITVNQSGFNYSSSFVIVTMEWLHTTYPELKKYNHKLVFHKYGDTGVHILQCQESFNAKSTKPCVKGCEYYKVPSCCPACGYNTLISKLTLKLYNKNALAQIKIE